MATIYLLTSAVPAAFAASAPTPPPPIDPRNLIHAVDAAAGTIQIQYMRNKVTCTYKLDDITQIKVNNAPGKFADIKSGMQVRDYVERDAHTLDRIVVDRADPAPGAPKAK